MTGLFALSLYGVAGLLLIPTLFFFAQIVLGSTGYRGKAKAASAAPLPDGTRVGVLIPAHNESGTIAALLDDLRSQIDLSDVLVVADNCDDDTAAVARDAGARVTVRENKEERGKGFALAHGAALWAETPPDILVFLDADCRVTDGFIPALAGEVARTGRPAQAEYILTRHPNEVAGQAVSAFAWFVMNSIRQRGLRALGAPARLNGTGMGFPWSIVETLDLATDHLVEDTMMGIDAALNGAPPIFVDKVKVHSVFPASSEAEISQRQRWESGQGQALGTATPRLLAAAPRAPLLGLSALDLTIPPITRFAMLLAGAWGLTVIGALFGVSGPFWLMSAAGAVFAISLMIAFSTYRAYGDDPVTLREVVAFVALKSKVFKAGDAKGWVRTTRDHDRPS